MAKAVALIITMALQQHSDSPTYAFRAGPPSPIPQYSYPLDIFACRLRKENLLAEHTLAVYTPLYIFEHT